MTGFGDVNVGDKVRLTAEDGTEHVFVVIEVAENPMCIRSVMHGWYYAEHWSVEVLEPAPKPLPTEPGWYVQGDDREVLFWHGAGLWSTDESGEWADVHADDVPRDLVRLVPESAVEEARSALLAEIVDYIRGQAHCVRGSEIEAKFGGKA